MQFEEGLAIPFYAGKNAAISVGGVTYKFKEWQLEMEASEIDVTNFTSVGVTGAFREYLAGFFGGRITASGPHDPTLAVPAQGDTVAFILTIGATYALTGNCVITKIGITTNIDDAARLTLEGRVTGSVVLDLS